MTRLVSLCFEDIGRLELAMRAALIQTGANAVICSDWRAADTFGQVTADALLTMLKRTNPLVRRGAIWLRAERATFNLQVERLLREAGNPERRAFRNRSGLLEWLAEVLNPVELQAATEFLDAAPPKCG